VTGARVFEQERGVAPHEVTPHGRARLDAIMRWAQDVAWADVEDAGLGSDGWWLVRRTHVVVRSWPRFEEGMRLRTFCSGIGTLVAERRTTIESDRGGSVDVTSVWVHLDRATLRPARPSAAFHEVYGASADGRRVRAALRHPAPPGDLPARPWHFRAADLDVAGHVNNAVYWAIVEEALGDEVGGLDAVMEHREAADAGAAEVQRDGEWTWIRRPAGAVVASACCRL
jgi:acyl-ACP thioesterase